LSVSLEPALSDGVEREIVVPAGSPATVVIDDLQPGMYEFQVPVLDVRICKLLIL